MSVEIPLIHKNKSLRQQNKLFDKILKLRSDRGQLNPERKYPEIKNTTSRYKQSLSGLNNPQALKEGLSGNINYQFLNDAEIKENMKVFNNLKISPEDKRLQQMTGNRIPSQVYNLFEGEIQDFTGNRIDSIRKGKESFYERKNILLPRKEILERERLGEQLRSSERKAKIAQELQSILRQRKR